MSEKRGKVVHREGILLKGEVGGRGGEVVHWLIEVVEEGKVSEGGGEVVTQVSFEIPSLLRWSTG